MKISTLKIKKEHLPGFGRILKDYIIQERKSLIKDLIIVEKPVKLIYDVFLSNLFYLPNQEYKNELDSYIQDYNFKLPGKSQVQNLSLKYDEISNKKFYVEESCYYPENKEVVGYLYVINRIPITGFFEILSKLNGDIELRGSNFIDDAFKYIYLQKYKYQLNINGYPDVVVVDKDKGLWDLYLTDDTKNILSFRLTKEKWEARNPIQEDILDNYVAIDFGTSSTVVAYRNRVGKKVLIMLGATNATTIKDKNIFENPTLLKINDFKELQKNFNSTYHRPLTFWKDAIASHSVKEDIDKDLIVAKELNQILANLKIWLNTNDNFTIRGEDVNGNEFEIIYDYEKNSFNTFDPIEYYAYLLGLLINNQSIKTSINEYAIFTRYFLSFPVKYSSKSKERLLNSFKKGLERSIPESVFNEKKNFKIKVSIDYTEPIAYAAGLLAQEKLLDELQQAINFAVIDFGGGTVDFAFGKYDNITEKFQDANKDYQIDLMNVWGNAYLGGENILMNICYEVFTIDENFEICLEQEIPIFIPENIITPRLGCERIKDNSKYGKANTLTLMNIIKKYIHNNLADEFILNDVGIGIFYDMKGRLFSEKLNDKKNIPKLKLEKELLREAYFKYVFKVMKEFFIQTYVSFKERNNDDVYILLAGNVFNSEVVKDFIKVLINKVNNNNSYSLKSGISSYIINYIEKQDLYFLDNLKSKMKLILIYPTESKHQEKDYPLTLKTGTAIGLLELVDGRTHIVNRLQNKTNFNFYVGKFARNKFEDIIKPYSEYDKWYNFGKIAHKTKSFRLVYADTAEVEIKQFNQYHDKENFYEKIIEFDEIYGEYLFVRIKSNDEIYCALSDDENKLPKQIDKKSIEKFHIKIITL